jgi:release factor glutamine methyltransferase
MFKRLIKPCGSIGQARREFGWMIEELLSRDNNNNSELSPKQLSKLNYWIESRNNNKPLQYILGNTSFLDLKLLTRPPVLIPRWETEEWTSDLIKSMTTESKVLDICSGTGCISLALASAYPHMKIDGIDISKAAIRLSRLNNRRLLKNNNLKYHLIDVFDKEFENFKSYDLVVSNPPYIPVGSVLDKSVVDWEDPRAIFAEDDGTKFYEFIANSDHLYHYSTSAGLQDKEKIKGSRLVFEIGEEQGPKVKDILLKAGFINAEVIKDLAGSDRVVIGQKP